MIPSLTTIQSLRQYRSDLKGVVGIVPTMGALHEGHAKLLREARQNCDHVILSIFVNPTQFNDAKDLEKYPRTLEQDAILASREGVDAIFFPSSAEIYPDQYTYELREKKWSHHWCGAHRPGHFEGMLTVVLKLFNLVKPNRAYFGEKDFQQLKLIEGMVSALFLNIEIVPVPTLREADGLAMSSRNVRLTPEERLRAPLFFEVLKKSNSAQTARLKLEELGFVVDYVEDWGHRRLGAIHLGAVRLIDNVEI